MNSKDSDVFLKKIIEISLNPKFYIFMDSNVFGSFNKHTTPPGSNRDK